jgi:hypothetical protein
MRRQPIIITTSILAAFAAGYFVRGSIGFARHTRESVSDGFRSIGDASAGFTRIGKDQAAVTQPRNRRPEPNFTLSARQLEAVLNMGMTDPVTVFDEMGLSATQIRLLESLSTMPSWRDAFHTAELKYARPNRDSRGSFLEIDRFPARRLELIESLENDVRQVIDDDRTPIIARAIIARRGLLATGLYRREISLRRSPSGEMEISSKSFKEDGALVLEDIATASPNDVERWGGLLDFPPQHDVRSGESN